MTFIKGDKVMLTSDGRSGAIDSMYLPGIICSGDDGNGWYTVKWKGDGEIQRVPLDELKSYDA